MSTDPKQEALPASRTLSSEGANPEAPKLEGMTLEGVTLEGVKLEGVTLEGVDTGSGPPEHRGSGTAKAGLVGDQATDRILDAALELLDQGHALSLSAVAAQAGLARGTLYRRFANVSALREALVASGRVSRDQLRDPGERLLDAVGELIRAQGLAATSLEAVARQAGVSPVTVYRRFGDRQGLLRAFVNQRTPRRLATTLSGGGSGDLEADLIQIAQECLVFMRDYRELFLLSLSRDAESVSLFADLRHGSSSLRQIVRQVLEGRIPGDAVLGAAAFLGMMLTLGFEGGEGPVEARARFAVSVFLRGVTS